MAFEVTLTFASSLFPSIQANRSSAATARALATGNISSTSPVWTSIRATPWP